MEEIWIVLYLRVIDLIFSVRLDIWDINIGMALNKSFRVKDSLYVGTSGFFAGTAVSIDTSGVSQCNKMKLLISLGYADCEKEWVLKSGELDWIP